MTAEYSPEVVQDLLLMVDCAKDKWGFSEAATVKLMNLSENATFSITEADESKKVVLRVQRTGYSSENEIKSELAWVTALARDHIINTAMPIAAKDGTLLQTIISPKSGAVRYAVAFERLCGCEPNSAANLPEWFKKIGLVTAKMHAHSRAWTRPNFFIRKIWDLNGMFGPNGYWGNWQKAATLTSDDKKIISQALDSIISTISKYGINPEVFGIVHADLRMANLLIEGDKLQVIDFDDMGFCWYLYDFAASLSFMEDAPEATACLKSWIQGYRLESPLSDDDVALLPVFSMMRRILLTAWMASHSEIPFAKKEGVAFTAGTVKLASEFLAGKYLSL